MTSSVLTARPPSQTAQEVERGGERQADHVRVAAVDRRDERLGPALDRIAAGLAPPFPAREVGLERALVEAPDRHHGHHHPARAPAVGRFDRDPGIDPVPAPRQQAQVALRGRAVARLAEDAPAAGDHRVGREDEGRWRSGRDVAGLGGRQAQRMGPRQLAGQRRLVDVRGFDALGDHPDLAEQRQAAGRGEARIRGARSGTRYLKR